VQAAVNLRLKGKQTTVPTSQEEVFQSRYELNDFPQFVRWRVLQKGNIEDLQELTGCALTSKGEHIASSGPVLSGQEKLYVLIEGPTEEAVLSARKEIQETIEKAQQVLAQQAERNGQHQGGRYAV
jgi:ATP-dependent RNA helicase DDX46/PRP5